VKRILVTGATGNVGGELVSALAARGAPVRALARTAVAVPGRVEVATGDLASPATIGPALDGVGKVFLLGNLMSAEIARAMREAGVEHVVVLTSRCVVGGKPDNAITRMWLDAEAAVRDSGVPWTFLRPSGFHSNALRWLAQLRHADVVRAPWPDVPIASIDPGDIAAVAAAVLAGSGHEQTALSLSGPEPLTPAQQVATLARVLGRPLRYQALSDEEARAGMIADTPAAVVDAFFRFFSDGEYDDSAVLDTVQRITGRPPRTFEQWAKVHASAFAAP
jgi:uncharacterized protein YbjT (DUF2867 family)